MENSIDVNGGDWFGQVKDYTPEKVKDDSFGIIKGTFNCRFNFFRIEDYEGEIEELKGTKVARYEIQIIDEGEFLNRRLWKRFYLGSQKTDKKGKSDAQKMADVLFTLGFEFKSREELDSVLELVIETVISVRAWGWTPDGKDEAIQFHTIKGQGSSANDGNASGAAPF
ncbi:hypothetical protein M0R04_11735 [Candidatus Dojkabacteria bacterium]|jgi:hypothetical protein|nr:hypothetical protein [Candidatus Dojkabacteria bacterium]